ncbi:MAG: diguanylate cyclase, partial [Clostridiales bacterium]|nr:diguanylate cyclase [Clostridiales bacterium]
MKKLESICLRLLLILLVIMDISFIPAWTVSAEAPAENKSYAVLVLNSYHKGYEWSDNETEGIFETLKKSGLRVNTMFEYLDTKNYPGQEHIDQLKADFRIKYSKIKIDIIIVSDDSAAEFALENRKNLFSDAPVVFCGINPWDFEKSFSESRKFAGVIQDNDPGATIAVALKLNPELKNVYVVFDNSESGKSTGELAIKAVEASPGSLRAIPLNDTTYEDILSKVGTLGKDSIVLITSYVYDRYGVSLQTDDISREICEASSVPVYHMYDEAMGTGIVGGFLLSGSLHGSLAAGLAIDILNGRDINTVQNLQNTSGKYIFDFKVLEKFGMDNARLPIGSELINKPFSFYKQYEGLVNSVIFIFIIMVAFILTLLFNIQKRKKAEEEIRIKNEELTALYQQITATEETLRDQYDQLIEKQEQLEKSQRRYMLASEGAYDAIWDYDPRADEIYISDKIYGILGITRSLQVIRRHDIKRFIQAEDAEEFDSIISAGIRPNAPGFSCEFRAICSDGSYKWMQLNGKAELDSDGNAIWLAGSLTDVTQKKLSETRIEQLAYYDTATGLPNRALFEEQLNRLIAEAGKRELAVMSLYINNMRSINDIFGDSFSDRVYENISEKLRGMEGLEILAKLKGEEFALVFPGEGVTVYAERLGEIFQDRFEIMEQNITLDVSMGISVYPVD